MSGKFKLEMHECVTPISRSPSICAQMDRVVFHVIKPPALAIGVCSPDPNFPPNALLGGHGFWRPLRHWAGAYLGTRSSGAIDGHRGVYNPTCTYSIHTIRATPPISCPQWSSLPASQFGFFRQGSFSGCTGSNPSQVTF